jgi:uncharacterized protein (TIGR03435 family)
MKFTNMPTQEFAHNLALFEDRPVVDQTGLPGSYDFTLKWTFEVTAETVPDAAPSLPTAIREQLGLRLESTRGKAEVLVIDPCRTSVRKLNSMPCVHGPTSISRRSAMTVLHRWEERRIKQG